MECRLCVVAVLAFVTNAESSTYSCTGSRAIDVVSEQSSTITSYNYPNDYRNNIHCTFQLTIRSDVSRSRCIPRAIEIDIDRINTEACCDYLEIFDGGASSPSLARLSGNRTDIRRILTNGTRAWIKFTSDGSVTAPGFSLRFRAVSRTSNGSSNVCTGTGINGGSVESFQSPGLTRGYYDRPQQCSLEVCNGDSTVPLLRFQFESLSLDNGDTVNIIAGNQSIGYTGTELPGPIFIRASYYTVQFTTGAENDTVGHGGFLLDVTKYSGEQTTPINICDSRAVVATSSSQILTSTVSWWSVLDDHARCSVLISSDDVFHAILKINILDLELDRDVDILRIYDGMTEDSESLAIPTGDDINNTMYTTGRDALIMFTRNNTESKGFNISFVKTSSLASFTSGKTRTSLQDGNAVISVGFTTITPLVDVLWYSNDQQVNGTSVQVTDGKVNRTTGVTDYHTTLTLLHVTDQEFRIYRVIVRNQAGLSELYVELKKPNKVPEFLTHSTDLSDKYAFMTVSFTSAIAVTSDWRIDGDSVERDGRYTIDLSRGTSVNTFTARLTISNITIHDIRTYEAVAQNDVGESHLYIQLHYPRTVLPELALEVDIDILDSRITITGTFKSPFRENAVLWYKNGEALLQNGKYQVGPAILVPVADGGSDSKDGGQSSSMFSQFETFSFISTLQVTSPSEEDFGTYTWTVRNAAGSAERLIPVSRPPVFPMEMTCIEMEPLTVSYRTDQCSAKLVTWIHSFAGDYIRTLAGEITPTGNSIYIPHCQFADAGTYTYILEDNDGRVKISEATVFVKAAPAISEEVQTIMGRNASSISVGITATPPFKVLKWFKGDVDVTSDPNYSVHTEVSDVQHMTYGRSVTRRGQTSTLLRRAGYDTDISGRYKVEVENEVGKSVRSINIHGPQGAPTILDDVETTMGDANVTVHVRFVSVPDYKSISWSKSDVTMATDGNDVTLEKKKYTLVTSDTSVSIHKNGVMITMQGKQLLISFPVTKEDFGIYLLRVENDIGFSEKYVTLQDPEHAPPIIIDVDKLIEFKEAMLSVLFLSYPAPDTVQWYKDGVRLSENNRFSSYTSPEKLTRNGTTHVGYRNTLAVPSLEATDMGLYRVAVFNDLGNSEVTIDLVTGC